MLVVLPTPREQGNRLYPLPVDYADLTLDGQRLARVNACRLFLSSELSLPERCHLYLVCIDFFVKWYLHPDPSINFEPMFHDENPLPTPAMHWTLIENWVAGRRSISIMPRGSAKSTKCCEDILFRNTVEPMYSYVYTSSTDANAKKAGNKCRNQWLSNERLRNDWSPEYGGQLVGKRTQCPFSSEFMQLANGSWLETSSVGSRQRGMRPKRYRLDDPEYDETGSTSMEDLREKLERLLFKVILPMVSRPGTGVDWIGTFVSKRHYLWHAYETVDTPEGAVASDPRFERWRRLFIPASMTDEGGVRHSCWEEMWPATKKRRLEMARKDSKYAEADSLEELEETWGLSVYLAEMEGRPGTGEDNHFGSLDEKRHGFKIVGYDEFFDDKPYSSSVSISWHELREDGEFHPTSMPLRDFCANFRLFICGDTSKTARASSDWKVCTLMAQSNQNDLFVLDMWAGKTKEGALVDATFSMANRWHCPVVHIEAIKDGLSYYDSMVSVVIQRASDIAGDDIEFMPAIKKLKKGMVEKVAQISALKRRFDLGKIKLPLWMRSIAPWKQLFAQIDEFNPSVADGGLAKDDHVDTVSMSRYVLKGAPHAPQKEKEEEKDVIKLLLNGVTTDKHGIHIGVGIDVRTLSVDEVTAILDAQERKEAKDESLA